MEANNTQNPQPSTTINAQQTAILTAVNLFAGKSVVEDLREELNLMFVDSLADISMNDEDNRANRTDAYSNLKYLLKAIDKAYKTH